MLMRATVTSRVLAFVLALSGAAHANGAEPPMMPLGRPAPAPPGFLAFCARVPDQCGLAAGSASDPDIGDPTQLRRELYSKYYWPALFAGATAAPSPPQSGAPNVGKPVPAPPVAAAIGSRTRSDIRPLVADRDLLAELDRVNARINRAIRYVSDKALYGDEDYWHFALGPGQPAAGDCKDYVLEKRRALVADGLNASDLSIAIVQTRWGVSHAVLLVATDRGELVLDSLSDAIVPWWQVSYNWVERQAPGQQLDWVSIGRPG
jgi:predicted transglutaminase-like cysteine proteinase